MIHLGDKVKDTISGLVGTAVARTEWINGCARITIQPTITKKADKVPDNYTVDEPQVIVLIAKKKKRKTDTGGPLSFTPGQNKF